MNTFTQSLRANGALARNDGPFAALARLFARLRAAVAHRYELRMRRAAFLNLVRLDDRMLDDIGLDRAAVERAASLPLEINASLAARQSSAVRGAGRPVRRH